MHKVSHISLQRISPLNDQGAWLSFLSEIYTNTILENIIIFEPLDNLSIKINYNNVQTGSIVSIFFTISIITENIVHS